MYQSLVKQTQDMYGLSNGDSHLIQLTCTPKHTHTQKWKQYFQKILGAPLVKANSGEHPAQSGRPVKDIF